MAKTQHFSTNHSHSIHSDTDVAATEQAATEKIIPKAKFNISRKTSEDSPSPSDLDEGAASEFDEEILFFGNGITSIPSTADTQPSGSSCVRGGYPSLCWLFVDTSLIPTQQVRPALGNMERERRIALPETLRQLSTTDKQKYLQRVIIQHQLRHPRGLTFWGDIQRYCYCELNSQAEIIKVWLDTDGQPITDIN